MLLLTISATLLGLSQAIPNYQATECRLVNPTVAQDCELVTTPNLCCEFAGEACQQVGCPTDEPTEIPTEDPTPDPSRSPSRSPSRDPSQSPTPKPTTTTPAPTTTTTTTTTCYCPSPAPITPTTPYPTAKKSKSKGSSSSGNGVGDCDCDKSYKLREIRFIYTGTQSNVKMSVYSDGKTGSYPWQSEVCRFTGINPNDEVICDIRDASNLLAFENETPIVITGSNGYECVGQYHTSCSSDIVDELPEQGGSFPICTDVYVSGWRDGNPATNDCDDGEEPCSCDTITRDTSTSTTFEPEFVDVVIGGNCYCDNTGNIGSNPTPQPTSYSKKSKKKKGKKGSSGGLGYGDCDCDKTYGMRTLRFMWSGTEEVDIYYYEKGGSLLCKDEGIEEGEESECDAQASGSFTKFSTNTYMQVKRAGTNNAVCTSEVHTSCSSDIVGGYGDGGCGTDLLVTGWSDGNPNDDNYCDDGYDLCSCEGVPLDPAPSDEPVNEINYDAEPTDGTYIDDVCFCSTLDETVDVDLDDFSTTAFKTKRGKTNGFGYGDCDCDGGFASLEIVYTGTGVVDIALYAKEAYGVDDNEMICSFSDVQFGDEMACSVADGPLTLNVPIVQKYARLRRFTYVCVTNDADETECGKLRTGKNSCRDVVGWGFTGYPNAVVTGWTDYANNTCDDGFKPCECGNCDVGYSRAECNAATSCFFDETSNTCEATSVSFYQRTSGVAKASYAFAVILGIVALAAF